MKNTKKKEMTAKMTTNILLFTTLVSDINLIISRNQDPYVSLCNKKDK